MRRVMPDAWPMPALNDKTRPFFTSGRILIQTCEECGNGQHPPEDVCNRCQGMRFDFREHSTRGTVYSHAEVAYPVSPVLADVVPYVLVLISLDDAPEIRIVGNLVPEAGAEVRVGMPVRAVWAEVTMEEAGETYHLPQWVVDEDAARRS